MYKNTIGRFVFQGAIALLSVQTAVASLDGYWPLNETIGALAPNVAGTSPDATLFNGAFWVNDPLRGQVLQFDGIDGYADAGDTTIPQMTLTNNFTWSFWSFNEEEPTIPAGGTVPVASTNVMLGNRYNPTGGEFAPREFIKFTPRTIEFHRNGVGQNVDYAAQPTGRWVHNVMVKQGSTLTYFRDGNLTASRTITEGLNNPQPLYFGGNRLQENWKGMLDDVAIWSDALPLSSVVQLSRGTATPLTASTVQASLNTVFSEDFGAELDPWKWIPTNRGLENNGPANYNAPSTTGGKLTLGGTTNSQYWFGSTIETSIGFDSTKETLISVDRLSLSIGASTAGRSSLWILGDNGQYLHFSHNPTEGGWRWNARNDLGLGTLQPVGGGNDIVALNPLDGDMGAHTMSIRVVPTGVEGEVFTYMYLDGTAVAGQFFTNFPAEFRVALTGQARAIGDTVTAEFDNFLVQQVPEPSAVVLLGFAALGLAGRRTRRRPGAVA